MLKQFLKYLLLWFLPFLPLLLSADHVHWLGDYNQALQKAHTEHKPLLVLLVKKDASLSSTIIKNVFMNQKYITQINQKMVPVIVTYEGKLSYPIEMYYSRVFPTLFFVDSARELFLKEPLYGESITKEAIEKMFL